MDPHSASAHRGHVSWQRFLLAVSLLIFWMSSPTAQITIELIPPNVAEGENALLRVYHLPVESYFYSWFTENDLRIEHLIIAYGTKKQNMFFGPAFTHREIIYTNASLLLQNVTLKDSGYYTIQVTKTSDEVEHETVHLQVYLKLPKPYIRYSETHPVEHKDSVVLTCEPKIQNTNYLWFINGHSLLENTKLELSKDNRTLTLLHVTRKDTGPYECEMRNPVSAHRSDTVTLDILYGPDTPTISPSDSYYHLRAKLRLSCHTVSNPPAQYSWLVNGRPMQYDAQELFIHNVSESDSGSYTCLVYNSATGLNKAKVKTIIVSVGNSASLSVGSMTGLVTEALLSVALIISLGCFLSSK